MEPPGYMTPAAGVRTRGCVCPSPGSPFAQPTTRTRRRRLASPDAPYSAHARDRKRMLGLRRSPTASTREQLRPPTGPALHAHASATASVRGIGCVCFGLPCPSTAELKCLEPIALLPQLDNA